MSRGQGHETVIKGPGIRPASRRCIFVVLALTGALSSGLHAGGLGPRLAAALASAPPAEKMSIMVTLADRVDLRTFADSATATRKSRLIRALQDHAANAQKPVKAFLARRGIPAVTSLWVINGVATNAAASVILELADFPGVEKVELDHAFAGNANVDYTLSPPVFADDTADAQDSWNLSAIHVPQLWELGYTGQGIVVASMDTGVAVNHPALRGKWRGGNNSWYDPYAEHETPTDPLGHGTLTMGIVVGGKDAAGTWIGVAPGAQWIAVKMFNDTRQATLRHVHEAFQWLLDPDGDLETDDAPDIVVCPWGFAHSAGVCTDDLQYDVQVLKTAGLALVFSAGNKGPAAATSQSPANYPEGFAVGAVSPSLELVPGSSCGPSACDGTIYPEVVAPGGQIQTTCVFRDTQQTGYTRVSGTSVAAPHVAGAMALLLSAFPDLSVESLESALLESARDLGPAGPDNQYGYGLVNALEAFYSLLLRCPGTTPGVSRAPGSEPPSSGGLTTDSTTPGENRPPGARASTGKAQEETSTWVPSAFDELLVKKLELEPALPFNAPHLWDIVAYLRKDRQIITAMGTTPLDDLVRQRYRLTSASDIDLAMTDLYELARLHQTDFYRSFFPADKCLPFLRAAVAQVLQQSPDAPAARLLQSYLSLEEGRPQEALALYARVCEAVRQNQAANMFTELARVALWLLAPDRLTPEQQHLVKDLAYQAGLPPQCPLAQYLEGKTVEVSLQEGAILKSDPMGLQAGRNPSAVDPGIAAGRHYVDPASLVTEKQRLEYWGLRVQLLSIEKDVRGLIELSRLLETCAAPELSRLFCRATAHKLAGRHSAAIPLLEAAIASPQCREVPGLRANLQYDLGVIYYEQGQRDKARETLQATVASPALSQEKSRKASNVISILTPPSHEVIFHESKGTPAVRASPER